MKIAVVSGSHRAQSQSERVARYVAAEIERQSATASVFPLANNPLPLWDEGVWSGDTKWGETWGPISKELQEASALVVVAPEWAGMVPPGLKNFLLLCSPREVGHKPVLIVSVSSGIGGSYPIAELRSSSYKNNRMVYIPEHVIVRDVGEMLVGDAPVNDLDLAIRNRIRYATSVLLQYAKALEQVRASGVVDHKEFPFGM